MTDTEARLEGRWLAITRGIWVAVAGLELTLFALNLASPVFSGTISICPFSSTCGYAPTTRAALQHAHIAPVVFNAYLVILGLFDALVAAGLGVLIFWRRPTGRSSWLASLFLLLFGGGLLTGDTNAAQLSIESAVSLLLTFCTLLCIGFFIVTFPDGRIIPRWAWIAGSTLFVQGLLYQLPGEWYLERWPAPLFILETLFAFGSPVAVQIYRFAHVSSPTQRQQTKWVVFSLASVVLLLVLQLLVEALLPSITSPSSLYPLVSASLIPSLTALLIPVGISMAVLRSHLYDIDVLINRALVYGALTVSLVAAYVVGVLALQGLSRALIGQRSDLIIAIVTLVVATLFNPWRRRLQAFIDRRFYRRKYDAGRTLARLSARLRNDVDLSQLTADITSAVHETVQPEHVSLWLR